MANDNNNELERRIKENEDWSAVVVFDNDCTVLQSTVNVDNSELAEFVNAFDNRDLTVGKGIVFQGRAYEVQRFHDPLIYGRLDEMNEAEGFCLCRGIRKSTQAPVFAIITYKAPVTSARTIPVLQQLMNSVIVEL